MDFGFTFLSEQGIENIFFLPKCNHTQFVSTVQEENPIAFGSNVPRKMFPMHTAPDRMGIEMGLRGAPHRGPGVHQPHPVSLSQSHVQTLITYFMQCKIMFFLYPLNARPKSKKGWYFGCRTGLRSSLESVRKLQVTCNAFHI